MNWGTMMLIWRHCNNDYHNNDDDEFDHNNINADNMIMIMVMKFMIIITYIQ